MTNLFPSYVSIIIFFRKSNSSIVVFEHKVFEFFDCHHFYSTEYVQNIHHYIIEKQKTKNMALYGWINSTEK